MKIWGERVWGMVGENFIHENMGRGYRVRGRESFIYEDMGRGYGVEGRVLYMRTCRGSIQAVWV